MVCEIDVRLAKDREPRKYENKDIRSRNLVTTLTITSGTRDLSPLSQWRAIHGGISQYYTL